MNHEIWLKTQLYVSIKAHWLIRQSCERDISVNFSQVSLYVYADFVYVQKYVI